MVRWRKARINVSDVESCLTKEDSQLVRSLMKREISDDVHQYVFQMKSLQVRTFTIKVRKRKSFDISAPNMVVGEMNSIYKNLECEIQEVHV